MNAGDLVWIRDHVRTSPYRIVLIDLTTLTAWLHRPDYPEFRAKWALGDLEPA